MSWRLDYSWFVSGYHVRQIAPGVRTGPEYWWGRGTKGAVSVAWLT